MCNKLHRQSPEIALTALGAGKMENSRRWALEALVPAYARADHGRKSDAYLLLSRVELLDSRAGASLHYSRLALKSAEALHDPVRAGEALELQGCAANFLGQTKLAETCAAQCLQIHAGDGDARALALAHNYLAAAATWQFRYVEADGLFGQAVELSKESNSPGQRFHPLVNQIYAQVIALRTTSRESMLLDAPLECVAGLTRMVKECERLFLAGQAEVLYRGMQDLLTFMMVFLSCEVALLEGNTELAHEYLSACRARASKLPAWHWSRALLHWAESDYARAVGNERIAIALLGLMENQARIGGHEPLRQISVLLGQREALGVCDVSGGSVFAALPLAPWSQ